MKADMAERARRVAARLAKEEEERIKTKTLAPLPPKAARRSDVSVNKCKFSRYELDESNHEIVTVTAFMRNIYVKDYT